jgi:exosortase F-associated protein
MLFAIYIFQFSDFLYLITDQHFDVNTHFMVNKAIRIVVNDTCMLFIIQAVFNDKKALLAAVYIQAIDLLILFPLYLLIKLKSEGATEQSSPFLSQLHRLIVNPTLMILFIAGIAYQKITSTNSTTTDKN